LIAAATAGAALRAFAWLWAADVGAVPDAGVTTDEPGPNQVCLDGLRGHQVAFVEWPTKAVRTPVRILGPLGGLQLRSHDPRAAGKPPVMDCELARALLDAAPAFRALGVRELLYSGAYQYRTRRRSTKLSEHAHGFAIDVHAFVLAGADGGEGPVAEVERDFEAKVGNWPAVDQDECIGHPRTHLGRLLRTLACRLHASSVFREVIIPDDNADHYNHFHLEAFPDALTRTRAVLARKPTVTDD